MRGRFPGLIASVSAGGRSALDVWPRLPAGPSDLDERPPVVGTAYLWDGDVVAQEAALRLDGSAEWERATGWHFEPGGFVPVAKEEADGRLRYVVTDYLGTPREVFEEGRCSRRMAGWSGRRRTGRGGLCVGCGWRRPTTTTAAKGSGVRRVGSGAVWRWRMRRLQPKRFCCARSDSRDSGRMPGQGSTIIDLDIMTQIPADTRALIKSDLTMDIGRMGTF